MQKVLKIVGIISAAILSLFGLTACNNNVGQDLYGVLLPPENFNTLSSGEMPESVNLENENAN